MDSLKQAKMWMAKIDTDLAVFLPHSKLPVPEAGISALAQAISLDPLLAMQVFRLAYKVAGKQSIRTLEEAVQFAGLDSVLQLAHRLPRIDMNSSGNAKLFHSIADSLVASSLLASWHSWRQVEWIEADHWACLFSNTPEWMVAYTDPMLLEGIEYRVNAGESADTIFEEIFNFDYVTLYQAIADHFQLPTLDLLTVDTASNPVKMFKYQALNYYLPMANQLATFCRKDWGTPEFVKLVARAQTATLIDQLEQMLPVWLADAARKNQFPHSSDAILNYFNRQPELFKSGYPPVVREVVIPAEKKPLANTNAGINSTVKNSFKKGSNPDSAIIKGLDATVLSSSVSRVNGVKPKQNQSSGQAAKMLKSDLNGIEEKTFSVQMDEVVRLDSGVNSIVQAEPKQPAAKQIPAKHQVPEKLLKPRGNQKFYDEYLFLFKNQVVRYSNEVIAFQALTETLFQGMGFSRVVIALHQPSVSQIRVQYREGTENRLQLHNLSFEIPESGIIAKMVEKPLNFWLNPGNAAQAWQNLPRRFGEAVNSQDFFLKSLHVNSKFRALIYVDVYNQLEALTQAEFNQFKYLVNIIERLLNHQSPTSSST